MSIVKLKRYLSTFLCLHNHRGHLDGRKEGPLPVSTSFSWYQYRGAGHELIVRPAQYRTGSVEVQLP